MSVRVWLGFGFGGFSLKFASFVEFEVVDPALEHGAEVGNLVLTLFSFLLAFFLFSWSSSSVDLLLILSFGFLNRCHFVKLNRLAYGH